MEKGKSSKSKGGVGKRVSYGKVPAAPAAGSLRAPKVSDAKAASLRASVGGKGKPSKLPEMNVKTDDDLIPIFESKAKLAKSGFLNKVMKANKVR